MLTPRPLPAVVRDNLPKDRDAFLGGGIEVDADRWNRELGARDFSVSRGPLAQGSGRILITRRDLLELGATSPSEDSALDLLWNSLAWGLGLEASRLTTRLDALRNNRGQAPEKLTAAWILTREGKLPQECYAALLTNRGKARISWLGAAFATKFLYFATGTSAEPTNLILDAVVARKLAPLTWPNAPTTAWWPDTYQRYCDLMATWAREASSPDRTVLPDAIEAAVFSRRL